MVVSFNKLKNKKIKKELLEFCFNTFESRHCLCVSMSLNATTSANFLYIERVSKSSSEIKKKKKKINFNC